MSDQELTIVNQGAVQVSADVEIDMKEIVSVGVAKMERKFGIRIKELQNKSTELAAEETKVEDAISEICKELTPQSIKVLQGQFTLIVDCGLSTKLDRSINLSNNTNHYVFLLNKDGFHGANNQSMTLSIQTIPFSDEQMELSDTISGLNDQRHSVSTEIVSLRQKMDDVPKLERQMRARVVESQLTKTEDGKQILDTLMSQFEDDLSFIG